MVKIGELVGISDLFAFPEHPKKMFRRKLNTAMIDTSSKIALKMSCLSACNGDVRRAQELYAFLADGVSDMPDYTPQQPNRMQQLTASAKSMFAWVKDNRDDLLGAFQFIQQLRGGGSVAAVSEAAAELPPIPNS
jgi:hypothetical protein